MTIDFDDDVDFDDDDVDLDDDGHHDDDDDDEHHDDEEYVPPAPRRLTNPRSLSPVLSARHRSGGLWPCGVHNCSCLEYKGTAIDNYLCTSCTHLFQLHLNGRY
jgi:hypothetical protein